MNIPVKEPPALLHDVEGSCEEEEEGEGRCEGGGKRLTVRCVEGFEETGEARYEEHTGKQRIQIRGRSHGRGWVGLLKGK